MIIETILTLFSNIAFWLIDLLPNLALEFPVIDVGIINFLGDTRNLMNFFLGPATATIVINTLLASTVGLLIIGIVKLIRYFLPL